MPIERAVLGLMAIVLLAAGAAVALFDSHGMANPYAAGCLRAGIIVAVLWLALPKMRPLKNRLVLAAVLLGALLLIARPRLLLGFLAPPVLAVGVALALLVGFLRPRVKRR